MQSLSGTLGFALFQTAMNCHFNGKAFICIIQYILFRKETKETQDYVDYMFIAIFNWLVRQENISDYKLSKLDKREQATEFLGEFSIVNYLQIKTKLRTSSNLVFLILFY